MISYFGAIWNCRHFWLSLVKLDLRTRYRRSFLGLGWSLLQPICMTGIQCLVFHKLFHLNIVDYAPHLFAGVVIWNFVVNSTQQGCQSFFQGEAYIRQCPMPLAIYPLRTVLAAAFHFLIAMGIVLLFVGGMAAFGLRELYVTPLINLLPGIILLFIFCWSMAIISGISNVFFQDTQHLAEVGFQMLFFATPIIYKAKLLDDFGLGWMNQYNPVVVFLQLIREPILDGVQPSAGTYLHAVGITTFVVAVASILLARNQKRLIFQL